MTGEFKRGQSQFRNHISKEPGAEFPPEKGRYHLYVSYACPWGSLRDIDIYLSYTKNPNSTPDTHCAEAQRP